MKNKILILACLFIACISRAQSGALTISTNGVFSVYVYPCDPSNALTFAGVYCNAAYTNSGSVLYLDVTGTFWAFGAVGGPYNFQKSGTNVTGLYNDISSTNTITVAYATAPPVVNASGIAFWDTNGGSAAIFARGVAVATNEIVQVLVNSNVVFQSNPSTIPNALWHLSGRVESDTSNNLSLSFNLAGAGADAAQFSVLSGQTNFSLSIGPAPFADTNLVISAASVVGNQAVAGVQGDFEWPGASSGGGSGITNFVFTTTNVPATSNATIVLTGVTNNIAYCFAQIPAGATGPAGTNTVTNTVTVYNFTNVWLSSKELIAYQTNFAYWATSNYLGQVPGIYRIGISGGDDGGNPPTFYKSGCLGSYTGTNSWFYLGAGPSTLFITNPIYVCETNQVGHPTDPGSLQIAYVDHPELLGRTNYGFGQHYQLADPINSSEAATKNYVDISIANATAGYWLKGSDTNNVQHYSYTVNSITLADFQNSEGGIQISSSSMDGTGTNFQFTIYATNLVTGWHIESSTNLALTYGWSLFTGYTTNISGGVVTFTVPMNFSLPQGQFFRAASTLNMAFLLNTPLVVLTNTISHSTNSTYGYGAGVWAADTNYFYVSVATNQWRRISIPTNTW